MKNCESKDAFMQEGFSLTSSSPKLKAKRRKTADAFEVHGGRVIRSAGRKDRHSKVCTATGLTKDRRVRLSPQTAIHFYDVQDRLGCDRPSKAIDWLMKEAKAAIDALDEPPLAPNRKNQQTLKTESGINPNFENNGFFSEVAAPPLYLAEFQSAPSASPPEIFDANLEIARLQRIFSWNYNFPGVSPPPDLSHGHMFSDREPLQSRDSPGNSFWNEDLLNFNGAATSKEDNLDNSGKSYSTASFLHYED